MSSPSTDQQNDDWRASVEQSYRNTEVREIAKVLAGLEPGASTSSKLRLAMQFEDAVFKGATSLADYRKKLMKRLKKVQKSYVPTQHAANSNKERTIQELRTQYGDALKYILSHATKAIAEMLAKHGDEKAKQLKQHVDGVKLWATDLGLMENTKPNLAMSDEHLEKLKMHLERRTENVRSHVVKLADPDQFMLETLEKTQRDFEAKNSKYLAVNSRKRYEQLQKKEFDPDALLKESMERALAAVPLPTRNQRNDERTALIHLDKMRAASTVLLAYMAVADKIAVPRNTLTKAQNVAVAGIEFVGNVMKNHRKEYKEPEVTLEDAWMKSLEIPVPVDALEAVVGGSPEKRRKLASGPVLRSKVLLTTGRKTPSNLVPELKRKRATLVRPPPRGQGSHLILEFDQAFVMTIYFVPLLVELRAFDAKADNTKKTTDLKSASWIPLHNGLIDRKLTVFGVSGTYETLGHVVTEKLRDASRHATHVLRKCFAAAAKETAAEFEIELLEATALLEFIQIARITYTPDWRDDDA